MLAQPHDDALDTGPRKTAPGTQRLCLATGTVRPVEEMIRYDPPLHMFIRTATADVRLGDVTIPAGTEVAALLGAANRDPEVFAGPDTFDIGRYPNPHLGFGAGLHFCLGAALARLERLVPCRPK